ncbi:hypothetical protein K431DRAFT_301504 [Polychaeton citri CBS 116435]|uniref:Autophagy-related protein 29 n=1 Tax=Polychaeton citri CBS 116435 TaxID=1314669 RepID=A0A9P4QEU9_9PEZI|nr:hypothetical protein K431DRAFT_301504 [Polychaeton citri CBS 116435]
MSSLPVRPSSAQHSRRSSEQRNVNNEASPQYTVVVRLPFKRGDFQDPPPIDWDTGKDKALWKLISRTSNSRDLNWDDIAARFDVDLTFLLQQAAWLYERHFASMKAQMRKVGTAPGAPAGGTGSAAPATPVAEAAVGDSEQLGREITAIATSRKDSPLPNATGVEPGSSPGTPRVGAPPGISRTPSTTTVTQSNVSAAARQRVLRGSSGSNRRPPPPTRFADDTSQDEDEDSETQSNASSGTEDARTAITKSRSLRRPPTLGRAPPATMRTLSSEADDEGDDDDDSSGGGYLPFAAASRTGAGSASKDDPAATLRGSPVKQPTSMANKRASITPTKEKTRREPLESSASSASSAPQQLPSPHHESGMPGLRGPRPGPLTPTQKAKLEELKPRSKKSGSEGTPSMGSSFSDLDNESVTQSALEEALMSNMGGASIASRMSSLGGAWKGKKR